MNYDRTLSAFSPNPPATDAAVAAAETALGTRLPADYVDFLRRANGGEGMIGDMVVMLWQVEELGTLNDAYQVADYAPGFLLIGSNGGGEAYAFDLRGGRAAFVAMPFVGLSADYAETLGASFTNALEDWAASHVDDDRATRRSASEQLSGREVFEIHPIILGGSPTDPDNKTVLERDVHIQAVRFWNKKVREARDGGQ